MADEAADIKALIEASSLGTAEAKALRATVSDEHAARIVKRAEELAQQRCPCGHDDGDHTPNGGCRICWWDHALNIAAATPPARGSGEGE